MWHKVCDHNADKHKQHTDQPWHYVAEPRRPDAQFCKVLRWVCRCVRAR